MAAKQGDIVFVSGVQNNGTDIHPAIVTRVFDSGEVNVKIFVDFGPVLDRGSVPYFDTHEAAAAYVDAQQSTPTFVAFPRDAA